MDDYPLLSVKGLRVEITIGEDSYPVVKDVSFSVYENECLCIVGESGCGKTLTSLSLLKLFPSHSIRKTSGSINFKGIRIDRFSEKDMTRIRGKQIGFIFQEPMTSLNPVLTIGEQISETIAEHFKWDNKASKKKTLDIMSQVGIPDPERLFYAYTHELSGGLRQRAMIGIALSCSPSLLIADEPTTALDVTIQWQILELLKELQKSNMSTIIITHNLGIVREIGSRALIMYLGEIVEEARVDDIFNDPLHPYTKGLINSIPSNPANLGKKRLMPIKGNVPGIFDKITGCVFHNRCDRVMDLCKKVVPPEIKRGNSLVRCHLYN